MKNFWTILACLLLSGLVHGGDYRAVLRQRQSLDGLWRDGAGIDLVGTLFAVDTLGSSPKMEDQEAWQRACAAACLHGVDGGSLLGALASAVASRNAWELASFHRDAGWAQEEEASSDWASTLLALLLLPESEHLYPDCEYLLEETAGWFDNPRLALLVGNALLRHRTPLPETILRSIPAPGESGAFEEALAMRVAARLGQWDEAMSRRELLLASQHPDGGWGEEGSLPFDLVTTCLVIQALDCARINTPPRSANLALTEESSTLEMDGESLLLSASLTNKGNLDASYFRVAAYAVDGGATTPLADTAIAHLGAGQSQRVHLELEIPDGSDALLLEADPEGITGDIERADNAILLPLSGHTPTPLLGQMLFDWRTPDHPYYLNPGFGAVACVPMRFPSFFAQLFWYWACDGSIFSSGQLHGVPGATTQLFCADCYPSEGMHTLSFQARYTLDGVEQCAEAAMTIEVRYGGCALEILASAGGLLHSDSRFGARESLHFRVSSSYPDAQASVSLFDASGGYLGNAAKETRTGRFQWNCEALPPGDYKAVAEFWDGELDILLEAERGFTILPTSKASDLVIRSVTDRHTGTRLYSGIPCAPMAYLTWDVAANIPTTCRLTWELRDENGRTIASSGMATAVEARLSSLRQWHQLPLGDLFLENPGHHSLSVTLSAGETELTQTREVLVFPKAGLSYANRLIGSEGEMDKEGILELPAEGETRITEMLRLELCNDWLDLPATVQLPDHPIRLLHKPSGSALVELTGICNRAGLPIQSGWLLCRTPYGVLGGEHAPLTDWSCGGAMPIRVLEGYASFLYTPQSESDAEAIIPIELIPWTEGNGAVHQRIGVVEINLTTTP